MPAPALRELQAAFWRYLAERPDRPAEPEPALVAAVRPTPPLAAHERLDVYARMYVWRIADALREDFPRVAALLGADGFQVLVRGYLARHPSAHPSLRHAGARLADFLAAHPPAGAPPWLPDLARLEWARTDAFDAPDARPLTLADLHALPADAWAALRLATVPAYRLVVVGWPVHRAWDAAEAGTAPALEPARTALRVWRDGFVVYHAPVDAREEAGLARLAAREPFAHVCEVFADLPAAEAAAEAGALLLRWVEDGIIAATAP